MAATESGGMGIAQGATSPPRTGIALAIIVVMQLMLTIDLMIVTVALPSIGAELNFTEGGLAWVVNAYGLALGGLMLLGGRFGDTFGRRRMFLIGVALFTVASFVGGFAEHDWWFLTCRALQGVGAALAMPNCLALIFGLFPEGPERTKAITISASASSSGAVVGLLLGGVLTTGLSWRWVMFVNVPIGVAIFVLAMVYIREQDRKRGRFDLAGAVTSAVGVALLVYGLSEAGEGGWESPAVWVALIVGAVLFGIFLLIERRAPEPIMPLSLFADRNRVAAYVAAVLVTGTMIGMSFFLTMFVQGPLGFSPLITGVAFLATGLALVAASMFVGSIMKGIGERSTMLIGGLLLVGGYLWLTLLTLESNYWGGILGPLICVGIGMAFTLIPATEMAGADVGATNYGAASSTYNTMQQLGGPIVLAILVAVFQTASHAATSGTGEEVAHRSLEAGMTPGFITAAILAGCVCLVSLLVRRNNSRPATTVA
ncbi:drug resistance transporter, EmrB/QacA subfamily [Brevibacterium aurantiacum]|uniref:Drug resistance transporter, EmrB/QacA subfamily n=1 Tax=Brevibacterium aurantiacum TaxID=273384 RepID=A0A2H1IRJ1_BREAU|nr:MFS transporter [Brevibacterium aurantiacum]SMX77806.1 drug resistance transporter, EmrB/QacA subfamily [Brevibacterium aurantiacum]